MADALTLARSVTGILLTARAGKTRTANFSRVNKVLGQFDAPILGVVLVGARHEPTYGSYHDYPGNVGEGRFRRLKQLSKPVRATGSSAPKT